MGHFDPPPVWEGLTFFSLESSTHVDFKGSLIFDQKKFFEGFLFLVEISYLKAKMGQIFL